MYRRGILLGATALAGCATFDKNLSTVTTDVNAIANGFAADLPQIGSLTGMTTATLTTISQAISSLQAVATSLGSVTSTAAAQPLVQKVETYVNTIVTALAIIPLIPPPFSTFLQAAAFLLPVIEAAVNLVATSPASVPRSVRLAAPMTVDNARVVVRAEAGKIPALMLPNTAPLA